MRAAARPPQSNASSKIENPDRSACARWTGPASALAAASSADPHTKPTLHGEVRGAPDALGGKLQRRGILEQGRHGADLLDVEIAADQAGAAVAADREERLGRGERDGSAAREARG